MPAGGLSQVRAETPRSRSRATSSWRTSWESGPSSIASARIRSASDAAREEGSEARRVPPRRGCQWDRLASSPGLGRDTRCRQRNRFAESGLLQHDAVVIQQLALEADAVRAHSRGEREPEVGASKPARQKPELEERLAEAGRREALAPLADRLDVVEPAAHARHQAESRLGAADHLLLSERQPGARKLASHEGQVPAVGFPWGVDVDLVDRNHVAAEHHRLEVEPPSLGQHARDPGEQLAIDILLPPGAVVLRRAEVLEGPEACHGVERPELLTRDFPGVTEVDVEAMPAARGRLRGRKGDADAGRVAAADEVQKRPPTAAQVEHPPARSDPDLL